MNGSAVAHDELTEFYRQLTLLVRSDLPLPESIAAVAIGCGDRTFRGVLTAVADDVRRGVPLAEALRPHPRFFPEFHVALIRSGERSGTLPDVLHEVAAIARRERAMALDVREIVAYPLLTSGFALLVLLMLLRFYLPGFGQAMTALLAVPLPWFSAVLFGVADLVVAHWPLVLAVYGLGAATVVWLLGSGRSARRTLLRVLARLPGTRRILDSLDLARICGVSAVLVGKGAPLPEVLAVASGMTGNPAFAAGLDAARRECEAGRTLDEDAAALATLPQSVILCLQHRREGALAAELETLREYYVELATDTAHQVGLAWQLAAIGGMALVVGAVILAIFMPLIELYQSMAAMSL